jgi:hypothetical protein
MNNILLLKFVEISLQSCHYFMSLKYSNANNKKTKTIPGISKWFMWDWPIDGEVAGYVRAKSLPNIGEWTEFSLKPGWALKENQKMGNKGGGKRISKKVIPASLFSCG